MRRLLKARTVSAAVVLCLVAGSVTMSHATASTPEPAAEGNGVEWTNCDPPDSQEHRLECAKVAVPLDWDRPNGKKIELAVNRHRASRPGKRIGSMFVNPGLAAPERRAGGPTSLRSATHHSRCSPQWPPSPPASRPGRWWLPGAAFRPTAASRARA